MSGLFVSFVAFCSLVAGLGAVMACIAFARERERRLTAERVVWALVKGVRRRGLNLPDPPFPEPPPGPIAGGRYTTETWPDPPPGARSGGHEK